MEGKTCLITGANGGIGYETARALARKKARVVMVARNEERGTAAQQLIIAETGAKVDLILGDLSLVKETKRVASEVKECCSRLDVLINNAGGAYAKRTVTHEGLDNTFALNVLAPFVLTLELLDLLKASVPSRIINVSSSAHKSGRIDFNNLQHEMRYARMKAYSNTKLALNLFTFELSRRLSGLDHALANTLLHAPKGIEAFQLRCNLSLTAFGNAVEPHKRRIANKPDHI